VCTHFIDSGYIKPNTAVGETGNKLQIAGGNGLLYTEEYYNFNYGL
jgi:hypothetical protein